MAISVVQHASTAVKVTSGTTVTVSPAFTSDTTEGNCLVAVFSVNNVDGSSTGPVVTGITSVTTSGSAENWAEAVAAPNYDACPTELWIYTNPDTGGGQKTVDINIDIGSDYEPFADYTMAVLADIYEVSGVAASSAVDVTSTGSSNASESWSSGATEATSQASEIAFGAGAGFVTTADTTQTFAGPGSGFTNETVLDTTVQNGGTGAADSYYCYQVSGYEVLSSTGTVTYAGTASKASSYNAAAVVTLKGAGGAIEGTASLAGAGAVSAAGLNEIPGAASLAGEGTVSASAARIFAASAGLQAASTLQAVSQGAGTAALEASGSVSAAAEQTFPGGASLAGAGTLAASGTVPAILEVVQHASATANFGSGTSGTISPEFGNEVTPGNCLVALFTVADSGAPETITGLTTGSDADNWVLALSQLNSETPNAYAWIDPDSAGGSATVSIALDFGFTASTSDTVAVLADIYEVSGVSGTSPLDVKSSRNSPTGTTSWSSGTTAETAQAAEIAFGLAGLLVVNADTTQTVTAPGSPWTAETLLGVGAQSGGTGTGDRYYAYSRSGYQILSGTGTVTWSGTNSSASSENAALVFTLTGQGSVSGTAALEAAGSVSAAAEQTTQGSAELGGGGTLTAAVQGTIPGTASLQGSGSVTASGGQPSASASAVPGFAFPGSAPPGSPGAAGATPPAPSASLAGLGRLTASAPTQIHGTAGLQGSGTLTAAAIPGGTQPDWGGYAFCATASNWASFTAADTPFTSVSATVTVPALSAAGLLSIWVGIGNLVQTGFYCSYDTSSPGNNTTQPWTWFFPVGELWDPSQFAISAGDSVTISLSYGSAAWYAEMTNHTQDWSYTEVKSIQAGNVLLGDVSPDPWRWTTFSVAEVIVEAEGSLPDYGTITFTDITLSQEPVSAQGIATVNDSVINQAPGPYSDGSFTMTWESSP